MESAPAEPTGKPKKKSEEVTGIYQIILIEGNDIVHSRKHCKESNTKARVAPNTKSQALISENNTKSTHLSHHRTEHLVGNQ